jgi:hypothetical protein
MHTTVARFTLNFKLSAVGKQAILLLVISVDASSSLANTMPSSHLANYGRVAMKLPHQVPARNSRYAWPRADGCLDTVANVFLYRASRLREN